MSLILKTYLENEQGLKKFLGRIFGRGREVDDLAQETFLRAFAAEAGEPILYPKAYLYRIARNLALNERARLSNNAHVTLEDLPEPTVLSLSEAVAVDDHVHQRRKMAIFAEAISALPPQSRQVFLLRKVHGLSQREVALKLGIAESTVEKHVASGLVKCQHYLSAHGYAPEAQDAREGETQMPTPRALDGARLP
jgi:RNA polymerase sigma-70 factor (ECF subfamily)